MDSISTATLAQVAIVMLLHGSDSPEFKLAARNFLLAAVNEQIANGIAAIKGHDGTGITVNAVDFEQLQNNIQVFAAAELLKLWPE